MRHLRLDPERIPLLRHASTFHRWQQLLLDGGLLFELPKPFPPELGPLAEVQDRLTVLRALEERISRFRGPFPLHTGAVPPGIYAFGALTLLGLCAGFNWFVAIYHGVVFLGLCAGTCCALFVGVQLHRKKELTRMEALQQVCVARLRSETARVLATSLDLELSSLRVSNTPHRNWLKHRIRELKERREKPGLVRQLRAAAESLEEGQTIDLAPLREEIGHPATIGTSLDALLD